MNFNPYQNYGAGIAALGPVQAMSDRNEAQTYMANSGQMFASGGIARLAEGGALPKYKYDPVTQTYVLSSDDKATTAMEEELLRQQRSAQASGGSGSYQAEPSAWDLMSDKDKAAYYAENPRMAALTQMGQKAFGWTGLGALQRAMFPDFVARQGMIARGVDPDYYSNFNAQVERNSQMPGFNTTWGGGLRDTLGDQPGDYDGQGPNVNTDAVTGYQTGQNGLPSELGGSATPGSTGGGGFTGADPGGMFGGAQSGDVGFAYGGLASLARGGMSHLGDYSDGGRLLRGPGNGTSDSIPATIADKRPARLADGEFVIPSRIVSELGNGSTEAGARQLYAMMDRIQKARAKTVGKNKVAVDAKARNQLPA